MNFLPDKGGPRGVENKMDYIPGVYEDLERKILI